MSFAPVMLIVGGLLIVFPEPATTATGLALVAGSFGLSAIEGDN